MMMMMMTCFVLTLVSRHSECHWWPGSDDIEPIKLGPDGAETRECDAERCPGFPDAQAWPRPRQQEQTERNTSPQTPAEHPDGKREDPSSTADSNAVLEVKEHDDSTLTTIGGMLSGGLSQATNFFTNKVTNKTNEYVSKIRGAVHEELYDFMESMAKKAGEMFFSPDILLGKVMQSLGQTAKTLIIGALTVVVCLIFTQLFYSVWTKIWSILVLLSAVALLHKFMGPDWIFSQLMWMSGYLFQVGNLMVSHPYLTCSVIVLLFSVTVINGCIVPIVRWTVRRTQRSPQQKLDSIELCVLALKKKMEEMELRQKEMLKLLNSVAKTEAK